MSANISIVNIAAIQDNKLFIECYLVNAYGGLRYKFDEDAYPSLKATGLSLLVSLTMHYASHFKNPILNKFSNPEDVVYSHPAVLDELIKEASIEGKNLDFDIDILDDSLHPQHPNLNALGPSWNIYDKGLLDKTIINNLPMVTICLEFQSAELLVGFEEGIWSFSAYDTDLSWL